MRTHRPAARAPRAMVASAHPLATQTGLAILRDGGGAVDAGLAVNAVLNVTQTAMCGFGGDAFFLYFEAASGRLWAYNASGRAPAAADIDALRERGHEAMPERGPLSVTVPGVVDGWAALHARFGRRPWPALFEPAIDYATGGFPISDLVAGWIAGSESLLRGWPSSWDAVGIDNRAPRPGERWVQPQLGATLEALARGGRDAFYRGDIAAEIARSVREAGGLLAADDLAAHRGDWTEPVGLDYRGLQIRMHGPNSQGWTLPLMLGLAEPFENAEPLGAAAVHLGVEAKRLAFADRDAYNTDPEAMALDPRALLTPGYLAQRRAAIDRERAMPDPTPGAPDGETTYFCIVDAEGNALSVIQSLFKGFGSGFVAGATGLFLQNRGSYFRLEAGHANALAPGKRTAHTLCAAMVLRDGRPVLVPGTMGGDGQPQILYQLVTAMVDHGLDPQAAIELPRWVHGEGTLQMEARFAPDVIEALEALGHRVTRLDDWAPVCGHAQAIAIDDQGLAGGADPRGDGMAAGY